jgi:hypothetical protein
VNQLLVGAWPHSAAAWPRPASHWLLARLIGLFVSVASGGEAVDKQFLNPELQKHHLHICPRGFHAARLGLLCRITPRPASGIGTPVKELLTPKIPLQELRRPSPSRLTPSTSWDSSPYAILLKKLLSSSAAGLPPLTTFFEPVAVRICQMEEVPRERAISSEPCSGRPNPFDDVTEQGSRKRQRVSRGGSRSRSVDTARATDIVPDSMSLREANPKAEADYPPSTPTREPSEQPAAEPTSSRVTINLRTNRPLEVIPSSPSSPSTPSKMVTGAEDAGTRISVESESDALSTIPPIETPSSSPSPTGTGSPQVELVAIGEDDSDFNNDDPPVAIINEDAVYLDPMANFPYFAEGETLVNTVARVARFLQYGTYNQSNTLFCHFLTSTDEISNDDSFCKIRDWIESYLFTNNHMDSFYELYAKYREFWGVLPDLIWALSYRRSVSFLLISKNFC